MSRDGGRSSGSNIGCGNDCSRRGSADIGRCAIGVVPTNDRGAVVVRACASKRELGASGRCQRWGNARERRGAILDGHSLTRGGSAAWCCSENSNRSGARGENVGGRDCRRERSRVNKCRCSVDAIPPNLGM